MKLSLDWECEVTDQIHKLVDLAKKEVNYTTDNFLQWFVKEQLEEVSSMDNLLKVIRRAGERGLLRVEDWLVRRGGRKSLGTKSFPQPAVPEATDFRAARERMVREQIESRGITDPAVLAAMRQVPRHEFVPDSWRDAAYDDHPLPIGHDQTISQPYIVALMTELAQPVAGNESAGSRDRLRVPSGDSSRDCCRGLLDRNHRTTRNIRGTIVQRLGYATFTSNTATVIAAGRNTRRSTRLSSPPGAEHVPPPLIEQLKPGGRMVIPVGEPGGLQTLVVVEKDAAGMVTMRDVTNVIFVPLTRETSQS